MTIGEKIKIRRKELNMTQKQLAEAVGITEATLSRYENNQRIPSAEILKKIAETLRIGLDYFADDKDFVRIQEHTDIMINSKNDIAESIEGWLKNLSISEDEPVFNGQPVNEETKQYLKDSFEIILKYAKIINKKNIQYKERKRE